MKKVIGWFLVCLLIFTFSTFLHECGHGLANKIHGVSVSTGFNRVGNAYAYPGDSNFRVGFEDTQSFLLDFGVPVTLVLAIVFTAILCVKKKWTSRSAVAVTGFALCNSIIRLVPCFIAIADSVLSHSLHMEDEIQTGQLLCKQTGVGWLMVMPVIISIVISLVCLIVSAKKCRAIKIFQFRGFWLVFCMAYIVSFILENYLDMFIRINWIG